MLDSGYEDSKKADALGEYIASTHTPELVFHKPCKGEEPPKDLVPFLNPFTGGYSFFEHPIKYLSDNRDARESFGIEYVQGLLAKRRLKRRTLDLPKDSIVILKESYWPKHCEFGKCVYGLKNKDKVKFVDYPRQALPAIKEMASSRGYNFVATPETFEELDAYIYNKSGVLDYYRIVSTKPRSQKFSIGDKCLMEKKGFWSFSTFEIIDGPKFDKRGVISYKVTNDSYPSSGIWVRSNLLRPLDEDIYLPGKEVKV